MKIKRSLSLSPAATTVRDSVSASVQGKKSQTKNMSTDQRYCHKRTTIGVAAKHVREVLFSMARHLDMLPDGNYRVPQLNWFTRLRAKKDGLLALQREQFLAPERRHFMISVWMPPDSTLALGCFDRNNQYEVLGFQQQQPSHTRE